MSTKMMGFSARAALQLTILILLISSTQSLTAQQVKRLFPSRDYEVRLLASARDVVSGAKLVFNADGPSKFGNTVEGEAALGVAVPLYVISGSSRSNALVIGTQGGVFGRFTLTTITRDLISTDWIFAIPVTRHLGDHWLRVRYYHMSSHIGDEYISRFNVPVGDYSRDVADFTAFYQASPGFGVYGGGNWAFNLHPDGSRRFMVRAGFQAEAARHRALISPYVAADVEWEQNNDWYPRLNIQLGLRLPELAGQRALRLALEVLAGPSPQGQFHAEQVRHIALGFNIDP